MESPSRAAARAFDTIGADYERAYGGLPGRRALLERLVAVTPPGGRVLDIGSGTGRPTAEVLTAAGLRVTGIDVSAEMVALARRRVPGAVFEVADVLTYAADDAGLDAVCAFFSLFHMTRAELAERLSFIARWLRPGGHLALATLAADAELAEIELMGMRVPVTSYPADEYPRHLAAAGFTVVSAETAEFVPGAHGGRAEEHLYCLARRPPAPTGPTAPGDRA
jgi:SAM-dependent methyltransferase